MRNGLAGLLAASLLACGSSGGDPIRGDDRLEERHRMVAEQIAARDVRDPRVLEAMRSVPRHAFVPEDLGDRAYDDGALPIGERQTISQPYIVALMSEAAALDPPCKVLEVGTGSGYQAAVLAEMGCRVYTIEIVEPLGRLAERILEAEGYGDRVTTRIGDGYRGWPEQAPFDAVIVTAAAPRVPQPLLEQLKVGGRLVIPVGRWWQSLELHRRTESGYEREVLADVRFVPMTGEVRRSSD